MSRAGHNWTNEFERLAGINDLLLWCKAYDINITRKMNMTHLDPCPPSEVEFDSNGANGKVKSVDIYGWMFTNFTEDDLAVLGIRKYGTIVPVKILGKDLNAIYDTYPFVTSKIGDLVCFTEPEKRNIVIATLDNFRYDSAADRAGRVRANDVIRLEKPKINKPGSLAIKAARGSEKGEGTFSATLLDQMNEIFMRRKNDSSSIIEH